MSVLPQHPSTLSIAKESLAMSEKTGDKNFQRMAIGLMALTGLGTLFHALHQIYRDLKPKYPNDNRSRREPPSSPSPRDEQPYEDRPDDDPKERWVQRTRVGERYADGDKGWAERLGPEEHGRGH